MKTLTETEVLFQKLPVSVVPFSVKGIELTSHLFEMLMATHTMLPVSWPRTVPQIAIRVFVPGHHARSQRIWLKLGMCYLDTTAFIKRSLA